MGPASEEIMDLVAGDRVEPAAKRTAGWTIRQRRHRSRKHAEHLLGEVGGIRVLQAARPGQAVDERGVQGHELPPGVPVARIADADQQTRPRSGRLGHAVASYKGYGLRRCHLTSKSPV